MAENLFQGLPPPSSSSTTQPPQSSPPPPPPPPPMAMAPALKSALKRSKPHPPTPPPPPPPPPVAQPQTQPHEEPQAAPQKRLRFKTSVDATEAQVIEAMQKIASHIKNPAKFNKASKLALQLIQAGSVKPGTSDHFFAVLESAMSSPSSCTEPSLRADYHALFSEVQDIKESFSKQQNNQLTTWTIRAVVANDLYTDDSFVVAYVLGQLQNKAAASALSEILRNVNEHPMVRHEAAEALGSIADGESVALLNEFARDPESIVSQSCEVALSMLEFERSGKSFEYLFMQTPQAQ